MLARNSIFRAAIVALLCAAAVPAHEIGTTRVSVVFREARTYDIEILTDATSLAEKLATFAGESVALDLRPTELEASLRAADTAFRRRVKVGFDATDATPAIAYSVAPGGSGALATIRLTGAIPPGARQFTWNYAWTFASYALTVRNDPGGTAVTQWLEGGEGSKPFPFTSVEPPATRLVTACRYLILGFTHIVPHGLDHMLFVLGIYLLSGKARSVLCQVSAFTVAHSITLGLSLYGFVSMPSKIVEPMIAVSIAYVAVENIFVSKLKAWRVALVFAFGLLHGMGFAGALKDVGLPKSEFLTALLSFNVGVETGQLAVIGGAFLLVGWHCGTRAWYRSRVVIPASTLIACVAVYWTVQRLTF